MDIKHIENYIEKICNIYSPTGYTKDLEKYIFDLLKEFGFEPKINNSGNISVKVFDSKNEDENGLLLTAHIDTLGFIVQKVKDNGRLKVSKLGGFPLNYVEGENVSVITRSNKRYTGVFRINEPAVHGSKDPYEIQRNEDNMEVVLDIISNSKEETEKYGISSGDFIGFDSRFTISNGFIKSRHLDDKASVGILLTLAEEISAGNIKPKRDIYMVFTTHEEVGWGASSINSEGIKDMIAVDMGVVHSDIGTDETKVSICAKDSTGPYNYDLTNELIEIAKNEKLSYSVDVFQFYGSDANAAISAGNDVRIALTGAGIAASHGYERTHESGIANTYRLLANYIEKDFN